MHFLLHFHIFIHSFIHILIGLDLILLRSFKFFRFVCVYVCLLSLPVFVIIRPLESRMILWAISIAYLHPIYYDAFGTIKWNDDKKKTRIVNLLLFWMQAVCSVCDFCCCRCYCCTCYAKQKQLMQQMKHTTTTTTNCVPNNTKLLLWMVGKINARIRTQKMCFRCGNECVCTTHTV